MGSTVLKNGLVFADNHTFQPLDVCFSDGVITSVTASAQADKVIDCTDCYVLPGLADIHMHGCNGHDLSSASAEALTTMADYEYSKGVTYFCPAVMTLPVDEITDIVSSVSRYVNDRAGTSSAEIVGINLEGPFVSAEKCGAQDPRNILPPSSETLLSLQNAAGGLIQLVTIAPEVNSALECISECAGRFHFSLGHTSCGYDTAAAAFRAGADHVTHLFNAMSPFHHRDTGLIGAAFDSPGVFAELICDGIHVSPSAVRAAFRLFGDDRIVLISDSMEAAGMPDGEYTLGGQKVTKQGRKAFLSDGTIAGSVTDLYECMLKAVEFGIPLESAVKAATCNPCRSIGIYDKCGSITPGKKARFLILRKSDLSIKMVI